MKAAEDGRRYDAAHVLDGAMDRSVLVERPMSPQLIIIGSILHQNPPRSPWQNGYSERLIGSIRRDFLDHVVVVGERHLRHLLAAYQKYYNEARTHLSLHKDAPIPRTIQTDGRTLATPVLGGLHHQYFRA